MGYPYDTPAFDPNDPVNFDPSLEARRRAHMRGRIQDYNEAPADSKYSMVPLFDKQSDAAEAERYLGQGAEAAGPGPGSIAFAAQHSAPGAADDHPADTYVKAHPHGLAVGSPDWAAAFPKAAAFQHEHELPEPVRGPAPGSIAFAADRAREKTPGELRDELGFEWGKDVPTIGDRVHGTPLEDSSLRDPTTHFAVPGRESSGGGGVSFPGGNDKEAELRYYLNSRGVDPVQEAAIRRQLADPDAYDPHSLGYQRRLADIDQGKAVGIKEATARAVEEAIRKVDAPIDQKVKDSIAHDLAAREEDGTMARLSPIQKASLRDWIQKQHEAAGEAEKDRERRRVMAEYGIQREIMIDPRADLATGGTGQRVP